MSRAIFAFAAVLAVAACGKRAEEAATPGPASAASTAEAVAQASAASAAEVPAAFSHCKVCHSTDKGTTLIGPTLAGVVGRKAGSLPGYAYSAAMRSSHLTWDAASLDTFLAAPMSAVPGTRMLFAGIKDPAERKAVIAYLKTL